MASNHNDQPTPTIEDLPVYTQGPPSDTRLQAQLAAARAFAESPAGRYLAGDDR